MPPMLLYGMSTVFPCEGSRKTRSVPEFSSWYPLLQQHDEILRKTPYTVYPWVLGVQGQPKGQLCTGLPTSGAPAAH